MCVFFISLPLYAQPSELFLKGQPLNIQSVVEFMVSSEWFSTVYKKAFSIPSCHPTPLVSVFVFVCVLFLSVVVFISLHLVLGISVHLKR